MRFSLGEGERKKDVVDVDFSPDNVRWAPDGSLLVAGQHSTRDPEAASPIFKGWEVVKLDPKTMKAHYTWTQDGKKMEENISFEFTGKKSVAFRSAVSQDGQPAGEFSGKLVR